RGRAGRAHQARRHAGRRRDVHQRPDRRARGPPARRRDDPAPRRAGPRPARRVERGRPARRAARGRAHQGDRGGRGAGRAAVDGRVPRPRGADRSRRGRRPHRVRRLAVPRHRGPRRRGLAAQPHRGRPRMGAPGRRRDGPRLSAALSARAAGRRADRLREAMTVRVTPLTKVFAAEVDGVDLTQPLDEPSWAAIRAAFDEHSVLVFHGQALDDDTQVAFSRRFGSLEVTRSMNPAAGTPFARQSNLDIKTGEFIPPDDRRMVYQQANMLWHSDSSFKPVPSLCSLLSARILPPEGGATEFASGRGAYPSVPQALKPRVESAIVVPGFSWSRDQVRPGFFTDRERAEYPPVQHPLVRANPVNGRKTLFLGAHASHIVGLPVEEGRELLKELLDLVTRPEFCYRHEW